MTKKLPWTKLRTIIAALGSFSLLIACYGVWLMFAGERLDSSGASSRDAVTGFFVTLLGLAITFISAISTIVFGAIYAVIVRNLRKSKKPISQHKQ